MEASSNAHEAAAGIRQAQKLMALHEVTERELGLLSYCCKVVSTNVRPGKVLPHGLTRLSLLICHAFGVRCLAMKEAYVSIHYYGPESRLELAAHAHHVVQKAMWKAWEEELACQPEFKGVYGAKAGFCTGWLHSVRNNVPLFAGDAEELARAEQLMLDKNTTIDEPKQNNQKVCSETLKAGQEAGLNFQFCLPLR